jgi:hypothetical protein
MTNLSAAVAMNDTFEKRVRAAAVAGCWVLLIAAGFLLLNWLVYLAATSGRPAWLLSLWGQDVSWSYAQNVWMWALVIFKLCVWLLALVVLWLTLWASQLRKQSGGT